MAKFTRVTIETESLMILRGMNGNRLWCCRCAKEVDQIALKSIGVLSNLLPHEVEEWLNSVDFHRSQTTDGTELICLNSLLASLWGKKTIDRGDRGPETLKAEKEMK